MNNLMKSFFIAFFSLTAFFGSGCYYDNKDLLTIPAPCDTTRAATYSGGVKPILSSICTGCHSGAAAAGSIKLDQYGPVRNVATSGLLLHVIQHDPGYSAMPKNGGKLTDCDINKITQWIAAGEPNN